MLMERPDSKPIQNKKRLVVAATPNAFVLAIPVAVVETAGVVICIVSLGHFKANMMAPSSTNSSTHDSNSDVRQSTTGCRPMSIGEADASVCLCVI